MRKVDLGCGEAKQRDFVGVDRFPLKDVDVVADLNARLPFRDDSIDLIVASHSLEHVENIVRTVQEVYRICKHGAQVCVIAPYGDQKLNLANPYHTCVFNEHTPRFWTAYPKTPVDAAEYFHPHAQVWGLSTSDHSDPHIDLRLVRMEFFYFPEYVGLRPEKQRRLRLRRMDVCDQVLYHLIVWKERDAKTSFEDAVAAFEPYEPESISFRRGRDAETAGGQSRPRRRSEPVSEAGQRRLPDAEPDSGSAIEKMRDAINNVQHTQANLMNEMTGIRQALAAQAAAAEQLHQTLAAAATKSEKITALTAKLGLAQAEVETSSAMLALLRQKQQSLEAELASAKQDVAAAVEDAAYSRSLWSDARSSLQRLCAEAGSAPRHDLVRVAGLVVSRTAAADPLFESFAPLREYSDRHLGTAKAAIVLGCDLAALPYREYRIPFAVARLSSVSVVMRPLLSRESGVAGVEVVSPDGEILGHTSSPLDTVSSDKITEFRLPVPLMDVGRNWFLRIFVKRSAAPVALYELIRSGLLRRPPQRLPLFLLR